MNVLTNEIELKLVYDYEPHPKYNIDYARNLAYKQGISSWSDNQFDPYLNRLIEHGILIKVYDFTENEYREALYNFKDGKGQITFDGYNYMQYKLYYNY